MIVPSPWRMGTPAFPSDALLRFKLSWMRDVEADEAPRTVGVIMYNPANEGELLDGVIRDGATHRRVRGLLSNYTEIRVANLSPYRGTKPEQAYSWERLAVSEVGVGLLGQGLLARDLAGSALDAARLDALAWACGAPEVVVAWGAGRLSTAMEQARQHVLALAEGRMFCWGQTPAGAPYHPSPLNRIIAPNTPLRPWSPS